VEFSVFFHCQSVFSICEKRLINAVINIFDCGWRRQWATFHFDGPDEKGLWIIQSAVAYKKFIQAIVCVADYLQ